MNEHEAVFGRFVVRWLESARRTCRRAQTTYHDPSDQAHLTSDDDALDGRRSGGRPDEPDLAPPQQTQGTT